MKSRCGALAAQAIRASVAAFWLVTALVPAVPVLAANAAERITFGQVLKDPDNIKLNFLYARQQVKEGNVKGASATLERILLLKPDLAQVRLFYAVVLIRLDATVDAKRELERVISSKNAELIAEAERYLTVLEARTKRTRVTASTTVGSQYDTNPSAATSSVLVDDVVIDSTGSNADQAGFAYASLTVDHDLGSQAGHKIVGALTGALIDQIETDRLDISALSGDLGFEYHFRDAHVTPRIFVSDVNLSDEQYYLETGVRLDGEWQPNPGWKLFAKGAASYQDYDGITESTTANLQSGAQYRGEIGARYILGPTQEIQLAWRHTLKQASTDYYTHSDDRLEARHLLLLGKGIYLSSLLAGELKRYDGPDTLISASTRRDKTFRARLTLGVPASLFVPDSWAGAVTRGLQVIAVGEYFRSNSNITNYTYSNKRAQLMLSKRWRF